MIDLDALERLAKNAGSDEWYFLQACTPHSVHGGEFAGDEPLPYGDVYSVATYETPEGREQLLIASEIGVAYGALMAAANPAVILDLIGIARAAADSLPKIKEGAVLPKLPDGCNVVYFANGVRHIMDDSENFSAAQMREYGAACAAAARFAAPASQAAAHAAAIALASETIDARNEEVAALKAALIDCARHPRKAQRDNIVAKALAGAAPVEEQNGGNK